MEALLTLFVALTAAAIVTQAGVLVGIYVMSKRLSDQFERLMKDAREIVTPMHSIAENLRTASASFVDISLSARDQFRRVETMVTDTGEALHVQLERFDYLTQNVIDRINETAEIVQDSVVRPAREAAAVAKGFTRGLGSLFFGKRSTVDQARQDEELFI